MPRNTHKLLPDLPPPERTHQLGLTPPAPHLKYLELRAVVETALLLPAAPLLALRPRGGQRPVMVIPGFLTGDRSTASLRAYLRVLGYNALPWRMGRNNGDPERDAETLAARIAAEPPDQPLTLIGWSLGGVIAREVARRQPTLIRQVITMGTPVEGGPKYTVAGEAFAKRRNLNLDDFELHVHNINRKGVKVPMTAIYSKSDGVVDWRSAIDRYNPQTQHHRVRSSHIGLGTNPVVWHYVERALRNGA